MGRKNPSFVLVCFSFYSPSAQSKLSLSFIQGISKFASGLGPSQPNREEPQNYFLKSVQLALAGVA